MRKMLCLLIASLFILCGCSREPVFTELENGNLVSPDGVEYILIGTEPELYHSGALTFEAGVKGEERYTDLSEDTSRRNGMYSVVGRTATGTATGATDDILIRQSPDNEWYSVYRKATLPPLDLSPERCVKLELFLSNDPFLLEVDHTACADGIRDPEVIAEFFADVYSQKSPEEAGLDDGTPENSKGCGVVYAFFEDEPELLMPMFVNSFNDQAYSVYVPMQDKSYVLPEEWMDLLIYTSNVG